MVLGFQVGEWGFLLPFGLHCEVLERLTVNPIPNVEPWFCGLLNSRGNIVPVIDLRLLLGEIAKPPQKRYLLAIDRGEKTMALWVDGYPRMLTVVEQTLQPLPNLPAYLQPYVTHAHLHNGQLWLKVQFEQFFKTLGSRSAKGIA